MMFRYGFVIAVLTVLIHSSVQQVERLKENDECMNKNGQAGICKSLDACPQGLTAIQSGSRPKTCGFVGNTLIICCPTENKGSTQSRPSPVQTLSANDEYSAAAKIANQKCEEYSKTVIIQYPSPVLTPGDRELETIDTCARREEPLVVGGENAKPKEFPHMVLIGYGEKNPDWLCGGSLISENFVLSAAHCSRPAIGFANWIKVGDLDTSTDWDDADPQVFKIAQRFVHPKYKRDVLYYDIALFKMEEKVDISEYIRPLCLFTAPEIPQNQVIATGWGHTSWAKDDNESIRSISEEDVEQDGVTENSTLLKSRLTEAELNFESERGTASSSLKKVKLALVSNKACNEKYKASKGPKLFDGIVEETQICAGDTAGKDTCQGDSGGPLQIPLKEPYCMYGLVGVTSFGKSCGTGYPGVYSRVTHYLPWIVKIVWPN